MAKLTKQEFNRLKVVLVETKTTSKQLADHLKVRPGTVSRWCTNDSQPDIPTLFAIAKFLNVKVCSLLVEIPKHLNGV